MTTTSSHLGFGADDRNSCRVLAPPGGQDTVSGLFSGSGDPEPRRQMSAAGQRNYDSNVFPENQENQPQRAPQNEQYPTEEEEDSKVHHGKRAAIRPSDNSFGNLGFGSGEIAGGYKSQKKGQEPYNIITCETNAGYEGYIAPMTKPGRRGHAPVTQDCNPITWGNNNCSAEDQDDDAAPKKQPPGGYSQGLW